MDPLYDAHGGPIYRAMAAHCSRFALQPLLAMRSCTRAVRRLRPTACIMRLQQHNLSVRRFRAPRAGDLWCQVPISLNSFQFLDAVSEKNYCETHKRPASWCTKASKDTYITRILRDYCDLHWSSLISHGNEETTCSVGIILMRYEKNEALKV